MATLKLQKHVPITASLVTRSGLHIGGTEAGMSGPGGAEGPIIRDFWGHPYIPGSSLKGKLRSLLEYTQGKLQGAEPCGCGECLVCRVFGPHKNTRHNLGPSRLIVRDAPLSADTLKQIEAFSRDGKQFSETKTETMIDRRTGAAGGRSLRTQERLPAGASFDLNLSVRVFDGDNDGKEIVDLIKQGLSLLEQDTLGGSGTRGYGWVKIENLTVDGKPETL